MGSSTQYIRFKRTYNFIKESNSLIRLYDLLGSQRTKLKLSKDDIWQLHNSDITIIIQVLRTLHSAKTTT